MTVDVVLHRVVEGSSRIPLHMMVGAALDAGVPFDKWDPTDKNLMLNSAIEPHGRSGNSR